MPQSLPVCLSPAGGGAACHHRQGQPPAAGEAVPRHEGRGTDRERRPPRAQEVPGPRTLPSAQPGQGPEPLAAHTEALPRSRNVSLPPSLRGALCLFLCPSEIRGFPGARANSVPQQNKDTDSSSQCPSVPSPACCTVLSPNARKPPMRKGPWGNRGSGQRGSGPSQPPGGCGKQIPAPGPVLRLGSCTSFRVQNRPDVRRENACQVM